MASLRSCVYIHREMLKIDFFLLLAVLNRLSEAALHSETAAELIKLKQTYIEMTADLMLGENLLNEEYSKKFDNETLNSIKQYVQCEFTKVENFGKKITDYEQRLNASMATAAAKG